MRLARLTAMLTAAACVLACAQEPGGTTFMQWGTELEIVGQLDPAGPCQAVEVRDGLAYICANYRGLVIADVSDPAAPEIIGTCDTWMAFDVALGEPGTRQAGYAFVADRYGGMQVIDVTDPRAPRLVTTYDALEFVTDVELAGDLLLLPCRAHGTEVVDVSDPETPRHLGFARTGESQGVVVQGSYAYVGVWAESKLAIVDISNPCLPEIVVRHDLHGYGYGLTIKGNHVYVAHGHHDRTMGEAGREDGHGFDVIDVSDPSAPKTIAVIKTPKYYVGGPDSWQCQISGNHLFLADGLNGLYVFDITDPAHPVPVAYRDTPGYAHNLAIGDGVVYVADAKGGLQIVRAEGLAQGEDRDHGDVPAAPAARGALASEWPTYVPGTQVRSVATDAEYAYLASGDQGLEVVLPGDQLQRVGHLPTLGIAYDVALRDGLAWVADGPGGVTLVDVSDPRAPRMLLEFAEGRFAREVALFGDRLIVLHGNANIDVYDITNPASPALEGQLRLVHFGKQVADTLLGGRYLLVANGFGLRIIDLEGEDGPTLVAKHQTRDDGFYLKGIALHGSTLVAAGHRTIATFQMADANTLTEVGRVRTDLDPMHVTMRGDEAWCTSETGGGLVVVDVSDPAQPRVVREIQMPGHTRRVAFSGAGTLVADGFAGMHVLTGSAD